MTITRRDVMKLLAGIVVPPATPKLEEQLEKVYELHVRPDDIVVMKFGHTLSSSTVESIHKAWESQFPDYPLVIMMGDASVSVIKKGM